ncbi:unnamed protein product [Amoebophrya sp. A120]|nr:unnamed protein product [Amoebophrya sp. A120]|eukprot:GSA120T00017829001.1
MWKSSPSSMASSSFLASAAGRQANLMDRYRVRDRQVPAHQTGNRSRNTPGGSQHYASSTSSQARSNLQMIQHSASSPASSRDYLMSDEYFTTLEDVIEDALCVVLQFLDGIDLLTTRLTCRYLRDTVDISCQRSFVFFFGEPVPKNVAPKELVLLVSKLNFGWMQRDAFLWAVKNGMTSFVKQALMFDGQDLFRINVVDEEEGLDHLEEQQQGQGQLQQQENIQFETAPGSTPGTGIRWRALMPESGAVDHGAQVLDGFGANNNYNLREQSDSDADSDSDNEDHAGGRDETTSISTRTRLISSSLSKRYIADAIMTFPRKLPRHVSPFQPAAATYMLEMLRVDSTFRVPPLLLLLCHGQATALHAETCVFNDLEQRLRTVAVLDPRKPTEQSLLAGVHAVLSLAGTAEVEKRFEDPRGRRIDEICGPGASFAIQEQSFDAWSQTVLWGPLPVEQTKHGANKPFPLRFVTDPSWRLTKHLVGKVIAPLLSRDSELAGCLYVAARHRRTEMVGLLLSAAKAHFELLWSSPLISNKTEGEHALRPSALFRLFINMTSTSRLRTPLFVAARNGFPDVCKVLLEANAEPLRTAKPEHMTPLEICVAAAAGENGGTAGVTTTSNNSSNAGGKNNSNRPTASAARRRTSSSMTEQEDETTTNNQPPPASDRVETLQLLTSALKEHERESKVGRKVLMAVCANGDLPLLKVLVEQKVGLKVREPARGPMNLQWLNDPWAHVARANELELLNDEWIRVHERNLFPGFDGADFRQGPPPEPGLNMNNENNTGNLQGQRDIPKTPLHAAIVNQKDAAAEYLLEHARFETMQEVDEPLASGKTALYLCCEKGNARLCKQLLKCGASLDVQTCHGKTPLHAAVEHSHEQVVWVLCEDAVDVRHITKRTKGETGVSPFMLAEKRGKQSLILPLLKAYHRQVKKRHWLRQCGDDVGDVTHPYLTQKLLEFKTQLFDSDTKWNVNYDGRTAGADQRGEFDADHAAGPPRPTRPSTAAATRTTVSSGQGLVSKLVGARAATLQRTTSGNDPRSSNSIPSGAGGAVAALQRENTSSSTRSSRNSARTPRATTGTGATSGSASYALEERANKNLIDFDTNNAYPSGYFEEPENNQNASSSSSRTRPKSASARFGYSGIQVSGVASRKQQRSSIRGGSFAKEETRRIPTSPPRGMTQGLSSEVEMDAGVVDHEAFRGGRKRAQSSTSDFYHNMNLEPPSPNHQVPVELSPYDVVDGGGRAAAAQGSAPRTDEKESLLNATCRGNLTSSIGSSVAGRGSGTVENHPKALGDTDSNAMKHSPSDSMYDSD